LVIGDLLAERLFEGQDPLGKTVSVGGLPYRVIGIVEKQGTMFGLSLDKFAIMPFTAHGRRLICPINVLDELIIKTSDVPTMTAALQQTEALMRGRRGLKPQQANNFHLQTAEEALAGWNKISGFLMTFLPVIVAISLVVGGMVIMNIMLMAVAERTREIGIRKSLGARRRDIMMQFIVESATLSTVGAIAGILAGFSLAFAVDAMSPMPAAVAPWSIGVGVTLGIVVGMVAGVYPAHRASKLDPIEALRAD
jgi:putative ABC transport system permease protein